MTTPPPADQQSARLKLAQETVVSVPLPRDMALLMVGWVNAHRPPNDWEPSFLGHFLRAVNQAVYLKDDE